MKNSGTIKIAIIILAVICVALFVVYTQKTLHPKDESNIQSAEIAGYGLEQENAGSSSEVVKSENGNFYSVADDSTVEMDSIPNDASAPEGGTSQPEGGAAPSNEPSPAE